MEFTIDRVEILKGLHLTQSVVERRTTQPILSHILLEAGDGWVKLTATDMEVGIETTLSAKVKEPGSICLGAKKTYEIIRELPEPAVQFIVREGNWLEIQCGKALFRLMTLLPEEFPQLSFSHIGSPLILEAQTLKEMINKTIFAVGDDETKYILTGALLQLCADASIQESVNQDQRTLRIVATDGHRLAMIERPLSVVGSPSSDDSCPSYESSPSRDGLGEKNTTDHGQWTMDILKQGIVIPKKALAELCRLLESGEITISFSAATGMIKTKNSDIPSAFSFFMRLLQGEFPDYRKVIPSSRGSLTIKADRVNLTNTLKRISTLSTDKYKIVKLSIEDGKAIVSIVNPDLGEAKEDVEIVYQGPNLEIGLNAFYLLEALNSISSAQVSLELKDEISATLIKAGEGENQLNLIMPIRI